VSDGRKIGENRGNAGKGRPKGAVNKTTALMKEAISAVYADLQAKQQEESGEDNPNAHFLQWAIDNATEFYKLAAKLLPLQINGDLNISSHEQALDALR
jgi:hypothetical protein